MSRTSRIPRRPGSLFVAIYHEDVDRFGLAGAAVLGLLDFLDRAKEIEGQPLANRDRLISELHGIIGKHLVDRALRTLCDAEAIKKHKKTTPGLRNLETTVDYGLNLDGLARILGGAEAPESGTPRTSQNREPWKFPKPVPKTGVPSTNKKNLEVAADAPGQKHAASANQASQTNHTRRRRGDETVKYGVEVWTKADEEGLQDLLERHGAQRIEEVAKNLIPAPGHRAPYLSAVVAAIQAQDTAEARATAEATRQSRLAVEPPMNPEMQGRGIKLLPPNLRKEHDLTHSTSSMEAK